MGFCELSVKNGVFVLTLGGNSGGEHHLTKQSMADLELKLTEIRGKARPSTKGLVTAFAPGGGSFCDDGIDDYGGTAELTAYRVAEDVRALFDMPFPTAAAVTGDVRSSLALALVLAHDDMAVWKDATLEVTEVRDGNPPAPPYLLASLLRDKAPYPLMRSKQVLRSEAIDGGKMSGYWYMTEFKCDGKDEVLGEAMDIVASSFGKVRDGEAYVSPPVRASTQSRGRLSLNSSARSTDSCSPTSVKLLYRKIGNY